MFYHFTIVHVCIEDSFNLIWCNVFFSRMRSYQKFHWSYYRFREIPYWYSITFYPKNRCCWSYLLQYHFSFVNFLNCALRSIICAICTNAKCTCYFLSSMILQISERLFPWASTIVTAIVTSIVTAIVAAIDASISFLAGWFFSK